MDGTLHSWNIQTGQQFSYYEREGALYGSEWNHNGSMIGFTTRDRNICVFDPRKNQIAMEVNAFDGNKSAKMNFMGNTDLIATTGHSKHNDRQIKIFDMKKFDEPVQTLVVDHQAYTCQNYYDPDTTLLFIPGRGESSCKYYELVNGAFKKAAEYTSEDASRSSTFLQKRFVNYNKSELATMIKLTKNWVGYVHFYYPKKVEQFDSSLFPECLTGEASNTFDAWMEGKDVDPIRKPINQINPSDNTASKMFFENETKKEDNSELVKENACLKREVKELETKLETERRGNEENSNKNNEYLAKIEELTSLNSNLTNRVNELEAKISSLTTEEPTD